MGTKVHFVTPSWLLHHTGPRPETLSHKTLHAFEQLTQPGTLRPLMLSIAEWLCQTRLPADGHVLKEKKVVQAP